MLLYHAGPPRLNQSQVFIQSYFTFSELFGGIYYGFLIRFESYVSFREEIALAFQLLTGMERVNMVCHKLHTFKG